MRAGETSRLEDFRRVFPPELPNRFPLDIPTSRRGILGVPFHPDVWPSPAFLSLYVDEGETHALHAKSPPSAMQSEGSCATNFCSFCGSRVTKIKALIWSGFAPLMLSSAYGAPHCPGGAATGIHPRFVEGYIAIVSVEINHSGPYDFMVDTGTQVTTIEPSLADELKMIQTGKATVIGAGFHTDATYAQAGSIRTGTIEIYDALVLVNNLGQIHAMDSHVRGVLGQNFLNRFDLLIDYEHGIVCLDKTQQMRLSVKGEHIEFVPPAHSDSDLPFTQPLIVPVRVAGRPGDHPMLLLLDSGSNAPVFFGDENRFVQTDLPSAHLHSLGTDGVKRAYRVLPPQNIQIGTYVVHRVSFFTPPTDDHDVPQTGIEGILPTGIFRRAFISYDGRYTILEPR
jgi:hypothetical protein